MIYKIYILLLLAVSAFSSDVFNQYDITYTTLFHTEYESSLGKDNNSSFPNESNHFSSWYNTLELNYALSDEIYLSLGAKANVILNEENYETPFYLRSKLTSDDLNRADVSEASLNYDNGFFALNIGRNYIDYDWLLGSMDGIIASVGDDKSASLRLFWFKNFTQLQYNYYFKIKNINDSQGMYGAVSKINESGFDLTLYDYYMQDLRNILGLHLNYSADKYAFNFIYTDAKALSQAIYDYDESLMQLTFEYLYGQNYFDIGGSITGENGLLAMVQLGSFMSGKFYLSNQIDRENAKNIYFRYIHAFSKYKVELLAGKTKYDNTFLSIVDGLNSYEVDIYFGYALSKKWSLSLGVMGMEVDENDPIGVSQFLTTVNLGYKYESF